MLPFLPYREPQLLTDTLKVCDVLQNENKQKPLLVTDKSIRKLGLTQPLEKALKSAFGKVTIFDGTVANPTTQNVEEALEKYLKNNCDCLIAFGGGSVMDCAKAVGARLACPKKSLGQMKGVLKVRHKIPLLVAIPTTAGTGSETTLAAVITDSETRHKYAISDFPLIPKYAVLDAKLTLGLPPFVTATTGMDALTHAIEAYLGRSTTKKTRQEALMAIKMIFENLETDNKDPTNEVARAKMLHASYLAGLAFTQSYVGYVHALAHALGGKYNIAHGLANAVILPYVLKNYGSKIHKKLWKMGVFAGLFGNKALKQEAARAFIEKIEEMNKNMGIPKTLDIQDQDIPQLAATAEAEANPLYPVPVIFDAKRLEKILMQVRAGKID